MIEVSIDGARGVLFNVAGGYDMSMSEIQEAAETITGAVAPDANIIFGATLNPELEDELVITVVATGFDREYGDFSNATSLENVVSQTFGIKDEVAKTKPIDEVISNAIDLELKEEQDEPAADFTGPLQGGNLWDTPELDDDESDVPAFLRRRKRNKKED